MPSIGLSIKKLLEFKTLIMKKNYKYLENSKTLNARINYNKTYGNFNLYIQQLRRRYSSFISIRNSQVVYTSIQIYPLHNFIVIIINYYYYQS